MNQDVLESPPVKRMTEPVIRLHADDNVVVARVDIALGTPVPTEGFTARSQVPTGRHSGRPRTGRGARHCDH